MNQQPLQDGRAASFGREMRKARLVIVALLVLTVLVVAVVEARPERETIWIQPGDTVILACADEWGRSRPDYVKVAPFAGEVSCSEVVRPPVPASGD